MSNLVCQALAAEINLAKEHNMYNERTEQLELGFDRNSVTRPANAAAAGCHRPAGGLTRFARWLMRVRIIGKKTGAGAFSVPPSGSCRSGLKPLK